MISLSSMTVYSWWGQENEPPQHLKTKKQLAQIGMKPVKPVGVIPTIKYDLYLYDPNKSESALAKKKPTDAQLAALAKGREKQIQSRQYNWWYKNFGRFLEDRNDAVEWARRVLTTDDWVILDTETTGLSEAEIVQIGIINHQGKTILNSLLKPTIAIPNDAIAIHGINNEAVTDSPSFPEIYPQIVEALIGKKVLIYNADFDILILKYCCQLHKLPLLELRKRSECVMLWYAQFCGEWSDYYGDYKWQPLNGGHNAIDDCQATLALIQNIATSEVSDLESTFLNVHRSVKFF